MKLYSKLSALGAVLVLSTAFASADTIYLASGSGEVIYLGYSSTLTGAPVIQAAGVNNTPSAGCFGTFCVTYGISPGAIWAAPLVAADGEQSSWVSYDPNSGPTSGQSVFDQNGFYTYATSFNLGKSSFGQITVAADDTVAIFLNGVQISDLANLGGDQMCADGNPNCRTGGTSTIFFTAPAGFNVLDFVVDQSGSRQQGLDYVGMVTETPEPNTLLLLGTGLLGSAGALFRKMRAA